ARVELQELAGSGCALMLVRVAPSRRQSGAGRASAESMRTLRFTSSDVVGLLFGALTVAWATAMVLRVQPALTRIFADMRPEHARFLGLCLSPATPIAVSVLVLTPVCHGVAAEISNGQRAARMAFVVVVGIGLATIVTFAPLGYMLPLYSAIR